MRFSYIFLFFCFRALAQTTETEHLSKSAVDRSASSELSMPFTISCKLLKPESFPGAKDAVVYIQTSGAQPTFGCSWNSPFGAGSQSNIKCMAFSISGLTSGYSGASNTYQFTVSTTGGLSATCSVPVTLGKQSPPLNCSVFDNQVCKDAILAKLKEKIAIPANIRCKQWVGSDCSADGHLYRTGQVGIGTSDVPSGFHLAVKGGITTDRVMINLCGEHGWCDYVFGKDYPLLPLSKVEAHIVTQKSLPNTHTQAQITAEGGYEVRNVLLEHQVKIEEAFLHLINLAEKVQKLREKNEALRSENELLKKSR